MFAFAPRVVIINPYQFITEAAISYTSSGPISTLLTDTHMSLGSSPFTSLHTLFSTAHLEQYADGRGHAHHADTHHRHFALAANRLLLHHMADKLLLGGHLWKVKRHGGRDRQRHVIEIKGRVG